MADSGRKMNILFGILTAFISTVIAVSVYHLWGTDWNVPLAGYRGDSIGLLLELNNFVRGGFVHHHIIYGEPYIGSFSGGIYDYGLLLPALKLISWITGSVEQAVNIHAVINCTVLSLCMFWVCTRLGVSYFFSMISGILYGNLSFFYLYANTVMMTYSACFYIPLFCYILLELMRKDGRIAKYSGTNVLFVSAVMLYMGMSSAYYTFFAIIILAFTGIYVLKVRKSTDGVLMILQSYLSIGMGIAVYTVPNILHGLGYTQMVLFLGYGMHLLIILFAALILAGFYSCVKKIHSYITIRTIYFVIVGFGLLAVIAYIILIRYTNYLGAYDGRTLYSVESGSLKTASMIIPSVNSVFGIGDHLLQEITDVGNREASDFAMIGVMAGIGFLYSVVHIAGDEGKDLQDEILKLCGLINCFIIIVAVKGGLSSVIAMFVTTGIRNYNRMCVFIAVFSLISAGILMDRIIGEIRMISTRQIRQAAYIGFAAVFIICLCMSLSTDFMYNNTFGFVEYAQRKSEYDEWQQYIGTIEEQIPVNGMILELPLNMDETYMGELMTEGRAYELNVPLIISKTTYWNTGGKIRKNLKDILDNGGDMDEFLTLAGTYGYEGIYIDTLMYHNDSYVWVLEEFEQYLGQPLVCSDNRRYFYSMAEYNQKLHE